MSIEVVGLVPAAGKATRLGALPCSKEIFPIPLASDLQSKRVTTCAAELLIEGFAQAGVSRTLVVLREGKWDIPKYLSRSRHLRMNLSYALASASTSVPSTLDTAYPFVAGSEIVFGFPDILWEAESAFPKLRARRSETKADVVLGLFPAEHPEKVDMVQLGTAGRIESIVIKPRKTHLQSAWILAVWGPTFTDYLHDWVSHSPPRTSGPDVHLGEVLNSALSEGLVLESVPFEDGRYLDIGTPEDLAESVRWFRRS